MHQVDGWPGLGEGEWDSNLNKDRVLGSCKHQGHSILLLVIRSVDETCPVEVLEERINLLGSYLFAQHVLLGHARRCSQRLLAHLHSIGLLLLIWIGRLTHDWLSVVLVHLVLDLGTSHIHDLSLASIVLDLGSLVAHTEVLARNLLSDLLICIVRLHFN